MFGIIILVTLQFGCAQIFFLSKEQNYIMMWGWGWSLGEPKKGMIKFKSASKLLLPLGHNTQHKV